MPGQCFMLGTIRLASLPKQFSMSGQLSVSSLSSGTPVKPLKPSHQSKNAGGATNFAKIVYLDLMNNFLYMINNH